MSAAASSSLACRGALNLSTLSDAEHALFTASLADLADTGDLEHLAPVPTVPIPLPSVAPTNPFLPTLDPSPEARSRTNRPRWRSTPRAQSVPRCPPSPPVFLVVRPPPPPQRTHYAHSSFSLAGSPTVPLLVAPHTSNTSRTAAHREAGPRAHKHKIPHNPKPFPRRASLSVSVPTSPALPSSPFPYPTSAGSHTASFALTPHPPVHPQRRASASRLCTAHLLRMSRARGVTQRRGGTSRRIRPQRNTPLQFQLQLHL
ncbi:hypothetical protein B0H17DRAFT_1195368 [Mycena rosella]|uniref:Uncharacterized protein n=1 Tax=Mycena rosella TaxID=1033263 RepID=A0AAD7DZF4_MYCRO|nr:hypothetical protein B0H17DRAFT_1195368 [Mycena rosella]